MRTGSTRRLLLAPVGVAACCGASTLAATAAGVTFLGITIEAWTLVIAGLSVVTLLSLRAIRRGQG